jgi:hypothetical protein
MSDTNTPPPSSEGQDVIVQTSTLPSREEFAKLVRDARREAKRTGLIPSDVTKAVAKIRRSK